MYALSNSDTFQMQWLKMSINNDAVQPQRSSLKTRP